MVARYSEFKCNEEEVVAAYFKVLC